jgi:hypothetical protein
MSPSRRHDSDAIARDAARLLSLGRAADLDDAIRLARQSTGEEGKAGHPTRLQVRRHAQAMSLAAMGEEAYRARCCAWLALAEDIMTAIEQAFPFSRTLLVGRAAEGHFDADPAIHIRIATEESTSGLAQALALYGYDDVDFAFTTLESRAGRLSQIEWVEDDARIVLTRCPQSSVFESTSDLVTGKARARLTLNGLRTLLEKA